MVAVAPKRLATAKAIVVEIDHDDLGRRVELGGEQSREPNRSRAHDRHGAARRNLAVEHAALEAGRQDVAEHHQRFFVGAVGDRIEAVVRVGNADELGLGAVDCVAEDPTAGRAVRKHLLAAIFAFAAGANAGNQNMVSRIERSHGRPNFLDDADALMAKNAAGLASRDVAFKDVQVGAANRRFGDFDDRVGRRRDVRLWAVFQGFLARALINERFHQLRCRDFSAGCWFWRRHEIHDLSPFR